MEVGDWILTVNSVKSNLDEDLGSIEGEIIDVSPKAILVEWESEDTEHQKISLRAWIPKSLIRLISLNKIENKDKEVNYYAITLPEWAKLHVTYRFI